MRLDRIPTVLSWKEITTMEQPKGRFVPLDRIKKDSWYFGHLVFYGLPMDKDAFRDLSRYDPDQFDMLGRSPAVYGPALDVNRNDIELLNYNLHRRLHMPKGLIRVDISDRNMRGQAILAGSQFFAATAPERPILQGPGA